jgi:hypothetical protein
MAIAVASTRTALVNAYIARITHASGHTASPGGTGANEMSGTGYARGAVTWGSPSDNGTTCSVTGTATVTVPNAGGTLAYVGGFSASTSGTFADQMDVTDVVYPGAGTAAVTFSYSQT